MKLMNKLQIGLFALIGIVVLLNVGMSYARYQSSKDVENTVTLASWKVKINNSDVTKSDSNTFTVTPTIIENTNVKDGKLAPESQGYFDLEVDASLIDTDYTYSITLGMPSNNVDVSLYGYAIGTSSNISSQSVIDASGTSLSGDMPLSNSLHDHFVIRVYFEWNDTTGTLNNYEDAEVGLTQSNFQITATARIEQDI